MSAYDTPSLLKRLVWDHKENGDIVAESFAGTYLVYRGEDGLWHTVLPLGILARVSATFEAADSAKACAGHHYSALAAPWIEPVKYPFPEGQGF